MTPVLTGSRGTETLSDLTIEHAGGWRLFMRESGESFSVTEPILAIDHIRRFPRAALGRAFYLAKCGQTTVARRQLDVLSSALDPNLAEDPTLVADLVLVDTHVRVYEDKALGEDEAQRLRSTLGALPQHDLIGQALACNHLCTVALHLGDFDKAQEYAETAIRLFQQDGAEFGSLHLHTHLGQIKMMRGDLTGAEEQFRWMEDRLSRLAGNPTRLLAVSHALRSEVAYEMNELGTSARLLDNAMESVEDSDAWLDILAAAYRVRTRLALTDAGLPGALTALAHAERIARERDMPRLQRLMQIERVRALTLSDELGAARAEIRRIGLTPERLDWDETDDWALRQGTTFVALSRWLVRTRRARQALDFLGPAEDFAIRGGQLLSLAKLRVIRAAAHWKLNQKTDATAALLSALRLLGKQPFRRFILDEGPDMQIIVQAALDGDHVTMRPNLEQRRRLSELTHYWATKAAAGFGSHRKQEGVHTSADAEDPDRKRYLELLALGHSNKEIARVMGVSVNTVKYHLKLIFQDLRVDNRLRAVHQARELGLLEK